MQPTMCSRCGKNVAVIFITKLEGGTSKNEGLCLKCARELGIKPIDDMMKKMGITDEELDNLTNEMMSAFGGAEGMEGLMNQPKDEDGEEDEGRTATFPFLNQLFGGGNTPAQQPAGDNPPPRTDKGPQKQPKRKFLDSYCISLTRRAQEGSLDPLNGRDVARILRGVYKTWDREKFMGLLHQFDLDPKKKVKDYSRGMKMKLSLAVALSHDSRLLLLDEPTSGLDPVVREEVLDMLLQFIQEPDRSVLFSSHILSDLERVCDYVTFLHQGKVVFSMPKEALEETYGIYRCDREELSRLPRQAIVGLRENQFGCEALLLRSQAPGLTLERAGIEEIMVLLIKGVR